MKVQYELASFPGHAQLFITCRMEVTESWVGPGNEASMSIIVFGDIRVDHFLYILCK